MIASLAALPPFDPFAPGSASVMLLLGARVGGLMLVAPLFSARTIPATVRCGLLVCLTVLVQPAALASATGAASLTPAALLTETLVGFTIGLGAALIVGAAEAAGELMAIQMGLSGSALFDPINASQVPALAQFAQLFALAMLLTLDAHLVMIDALAASVDYVPVGSPPDATAGVRSMVSLGATLFSLGLRFAAPVVAATLIANVALAILSRAAPQLNILSVAFPIQIGVGLFALAASLPFIATFFTGWSATYDGMLTRALGAFAGPGGGAGAR